MTRFCEYIRVNTMHPNPDYKKAEEFIKKYGDELELEFSKHESQESHVSFWLGEEAKPHFSQFCWTRTSTWCRFFRRNGITSPFQLTKQMMAGFTGAALKTWNASESGIWRPLDCLKNRSFCRKNQVNILNIFISNEKTLFRISRRNGRSTCFGLRTKKSAATTEWSFSSKVTFGRISTSDSHSTKDLP